MPSRVPHDLEAEKAVIAATMYRQDEIGELGIDLEPGDFYAPSHASVWAAFQELYFNEGIGHTDAVMLADRAKQHGPGMSVEALQEYMQASQTLAPEHIEIISRHKAGRTLLGYYAEGNRSIYDGENPYQIADNTQQLLSSLGSRNTNVQEALTYDQIVDRWGNDSVPWVIPGLMQQDFRTIIVGGEGRGKSHLLRVMAQTAAQGVHPFFATRHFPPVRTLVVDAENPLGSYFPSLTTLEIALESISKDYQQDRFRIWRQPGGLNIRKQSDRANLRREIILQKPQLVCMGPVYKIARRRGNENYEDAADEAMAIMDELRTKYNFALVLEAHAAKGAHGARRQMDPMGSQRYLAWPEVGISLYPDDNVPNGLVVERFRGDRISGLNWPSALYRDSVYQIQGRFDNGIS